MTGNVTFKRGLRAKFDALPEKDPLTAYWLKDTQELYVGDVLYGVGREATEALSGLLSAQDKVALNALVAGALTGLTAVDASVVVDGDAKQKTVKVQLTGADGNTLRLLGDGLGVPSYTVERQDVESDAYSAVYRLKRTLGDESEYIGDTISIPRDLMLRSGVLRTVKTDGVPYTGALVGDPYLDLVLNDLEADHIYVPVRELVDVYTAGDGIQIENNVVRTQNRTVERLTGANGTAIIWNESDGGGVKFEHVDGTWSFAGVNDGGKDGITGQLYSVDSATKLGTRLNLTSNGFFYFKGKTSALDYTAEDEIATKRDILDAMLYWEEI